MSEKWNAKDNLKPKGLEGISDQQIEYHFETHYKGYVNKLNEIWEKLPSVDRSKANQNYSEFRELKLEETFNFDGSLLHELYFQNLNREHNPVPDSFKKEVEKSFGSYEKWVEDFKATGVAFREEKQEMLKDYFLNILDAFRNGGISSKIFPVSAREMSGFEDIYSEMSMFLTGGADVDTTYKDD